MRRMLTAIIIPDGVGLSSLAGFDDLLYERPICPRVDRFRKDMLQHYIDDGMPIIGIGDGAAMLWNQIGQKLSIVHDNVVMLPPKDNIQGIVYQLDDLNLVSKFSYGSLYGLKDLVGLRPLLLKINSLVETSAKEEVFSI